MIAAWLLVAVIAADGFVPVPQPLPPDEQPPAQVLGPGDRLDIEMSGLEGTLQTCVVGLDGMLYYGPTPGVRVQGMSLAAAADAVTDQMRAFHRHPQLSVNLRQMVSRTATVLGRVNTPGTVPLSGSERILDLLAATGFLATSRFSGSTEELADLSGALYLRGGRQLPVDFVGLVRRGDLRHNIRVHPGDYCYIPSSLSREVFVLGAVNQPKPVGFSEGLTAGRVVISAQGPTADAWPDRAIIIRGSAAAPTAARVDITAIIEGRAPDIPLLPRDIVYVPGATSEDPGKLARIAVDSFAAGLAGTLAARVYAEVARP